MEPRLSLNGWFTLTSEVVSVITAILRGLQFIKTNRSETILLMQKLLKMEKTMAESAYDLSLKSYSADGTASVKGIQNVIDMTPTPGASRPATPAEVVDFGPLREAQAVLGVR